ncbi:hypothetical protein AYI68_g5130 [Smittium mucronatum]|uniref:Reverse transcriptase domain-containing protein n=1 Tax=Smittium mucronatum TaxID=133383 RepID=A0A1R0GV63_9FUNG|nr:hypothetical protein AYI68_g5130 [Smittium mucronatum]
MQTENNLSAFSESHNQGSASFQEAFLKLFSSSLLEWDKKDISRQRLREMPFEKITIFIVRKDVVFVASNLLRVSFSHLFPKSKINSYIKSGKKLIMSFMISVMAKDIINTNTSLDQKLELSAIQLVEIVEVIVHLYSSTDCPLNYQEVISHLKIFAERFRLFDSMFDEWSSLDRAISIQALRNQMSAMESVKIAIQKRDLSAEETAKWLGTVDTYRSQIDTRIKQFSRFKSDRRNDSSKRPSSTSSPSAILPPVNLRKIMSYEQFDLNLVHEKLMNPEGPLQLPSCGIKYRTKILMHKAYFDSIFESLYPYDLSSINYQPILKLVDDIRIMLIKCFPKRSRVLSHNPFDKNRLKKVSLNSFYLSEIKVNLDRNLIKKQILNSAFCASSLFTFILDMIHKISMPIRDQDTESIELYLHSPPPLDHGKDIFEFYMNVCKRILELLEKIQMDLMFYELKCTLNSKFIYRNRSTSSLRSPLHYLNHKNDKKEFLTLIERCYFVNNFKLFDSKKDSLSIRIPGTCNFISQGRDVISSSHLLSSIDPISDLLDNPKLVFSASICNLLFSKPSSPILFDFHINDLFDSIQGVYVPGLTSRIPGLLFADDAVLLAESEADMQI